MMELVNRCKTTLVEFNLFPTHTASDDDPHQKKIQLISTRLLIFLLLSSLIVLLIYTVRLSFNANITVEHPSLSTYLQLETKYSGGLTCPCTNIAIERRDFLSLTPTFHQVCSSDFIADRWLNYLRSAATLYVSSDFRFTGSVLFTILASFCHLANQTISDSLPSFYSTRFVSSKVINPEQFEKEVSSIADLYISTTSNAFAQSFELIGNSTYADGLFSGLKTNFQYEDIFYFESWDAYIPKPFYGTYDGCSCEISPSCIAPARISNVFTVPGLYIGCYLIEAMRRSNLACLYNQTCLDELSLNLRAPINFTARAMIRSNSSRFPLSSKISEMLDVMMIETWNQNVSHASYFAQCNPLSCTTTIVQQHGIVYIVTSILGIFGGLSKGLSFIVPLIVGWIINRYRKRRVISDDRIPVVVAPEQSLSIYERISIDLKKIWSLNMFPSYPPSTDPYALKTERLTTFVFILSMIVSVLVLISYTASQSTVQTISTDSPSLDEYRELHEQHSTDGLSCPCLVITSRYGDMMTLTPAYHEYCSSEFVSDLWSSFGIPKDVYYGWLDFRRSASLIFHSLASYCSLSERTIINQLRLFQSTSMISSTLLSETVFRDRINEVFVRFTRSVGEDFSLQLDFLRMNTYGNQLLNGLMTNCAITFVGPTSDGQYILVTQPTPSSPDCDCESSPTCSGYAFFYTGNGTSSTETYYVPGIRIGCYNNEALRQSTFECFYDPDCVSQLKRYLSLQNLLTRTLNSSKMTLFNRSTTIGVIIESLMIDQWIWNASYSNYYHLCRPVYCSYKIVTKTPLIVIVTTLLGLFGGLMKILQIVVPIVVRFFRRQPPRENVDVRPRAIQYKEKMLQVIKTFNLFRTQTPLDEQIDPARIQIVSTRLFLVTLILSLIILLSYTSQSEISRTLIIPSPSHSAYTTFYDKYGDQISCPCTNIASTQDHWISINALFHPICSSNFIDPAWSDMMYATYFTVDAVIYNRDFRYRSPYYFQSLASLCQLANRSLSDSLRHFYSNTFVSTQLVHSPVFLTQTNATIHAFQTSLLNTFVRSFRVLRDTNYGNALISSLLSSFSFSLAINGTLNIDDRSTWEVNFRYKAYNSSQCSCRDTSMCIEQAQVYTFDTYIPLFSIPGMFVGCYIFEALIQSNLHYFYNQTNVDDLVNQISVNQSAKFQAMNASNADGFAFDEPIERILERMMINRWTQNVSFENYFDQCQPTECRYSYMERFDLLYIITTVTALIGGLTSALQLIIPRFVRVVRLHRCFSH